MKWQDVSLTSSKMGSSNFSGFPVPLRGGFAGRKQKARRYGRALNRNLDGSGGRGRRDLIELLFERVCCLNAGKLDGDALLEMTDDLAMHGAE